MNDINLNIPYARIIPEKTLKRFTTRLLDSDKCEFNHSTDKFIDNRFQIIKALPHVGLLKCYTVIDHTTTSRCGTCGAINNPDSTIFCDQCGYQLSDSRFVILEGSKEQIIGFEPLIRNNLRHKGILRFFELFYWQERYYIVAQNLEDKKLSDRAFNFHFSQLLDFTTQIIQSLDFLHQHNIFNVDVSPTVIFIGPEGPRLVNFSDSIIAKSDVARWIKSDLTKLAKTFLLFLSRITSKDKNMPFLKSIFTKAIQGGYYSARDFLDEIAGINQIIDNTEPLYPEKKTVLLTNKGVSISVGMASDVGMVRTLNEDSVSAFELTNILQSISTPYGFYMVADGMGGHQAGEEASKIAVEYVTRKIIDSFNDTFEPSEKNARQILEHAVFSANSEIYKIAKLKNNDMGTTVTIAYLVNNNAFILNIGDARAYLYSNQKLKLITQDHSLVYRLYKIGQLNYEEIYHHPQSNQILCALGEPNLQQSLINLEKQANHPYFFSITLERDDGLLLCTDGLWQMIEDLEIEEILNRHSQPQAAVDELVNIANDYGGDDNISLIFVKTQ